MIGLPVVNLNIIHFSHSRPEHQDQQQGSNQGREKYFFDRTMKIMNNILAISWLSCWSTWWWSGWGRFSSWDLLSSCWLPQTLRQMGEEGKGTVKYMIFVRNLWGKCSNFISLPLYQFNNFSSSSLWRWRLMWLRRREGLSCLRSTLKMQVFFGFVDTFSMRCLCFLWICWYFFNVMSLFL